MLRAATRRRGEAGGDDVRGERGQPVVVHRGGRDRRDVVDRPGRPDAGPRTAGRRRWPRRPRGTSWRPTRGPTDPDDDPARRGVRTDPVSRESRLGPDHPADGRRAMPGMPRIGLEIVDVRDLADIHIRAMTSPDAAGQRFLATGEFIWMREMAAGAAGRPRPGRGQGADPATARLRGPVRGAVRRVAPGDHRLAGPPNRHSTDKAKRCSAGSPGRRPRPLSAARRA